MVVGNLPTIGVLWLVITVGAVVQEIKGVERFVFG